MHGARRYDGIPADGIEGAPASGKSNPSRPRPISSHIWTANCLECLDGRLSADAAAGTQIEVTFEPTEIDARVARERDGYLILSRNCDASDLAAVAQDAFREQKSGGEFLIIARRSDGD